MTKHKIILEYEAELKNTLNDQYYALKYWICFGHTWKNKMIEYQNDQIILNNRGVLGSYIIDMNPILVVDILTSDFSKYRSIYSNHFAI